ncbi:putative F0F1-ATPase subunit [mine drainage metagenome]|uniref:Putative F0F1-ATPase subunit n=1 Tax=mine drainage metagenome TaxID=410659 RepID=A0A1J5PXQ2_9ZZZZ
MAHEPTGPVPRPSQEQKESSAYVGQVGQQATRKLRARRNPVPGVWFGLGMMGLVGWSVVVPTLLGAAIGLWLDRSNLGGHSWTLALLVAGLTLGCANAWHWVSKEDAAMHDAQESGDD